MTLSSVNRHQKDLSICAKLLDHNTMTMRHLDLHQKKYRPDIDGLRAVAVLAVVVFHAFPNLLKGGFVGVDVFFVISGYLITINILENLERGTFSFYSFYFRRIRRIFPALVIVLFACITFGYFFLLPEEFKNLGKHIAAGAGFVSNLALANEIGYFDASAETKPLLHLWSLGIEEQFYIVWPLLLWFAWKLNFNLLTITIIATTVSFILNLKGVKLDAAATFYSPLTRVWELLFGSILAYLAIFRTDFCLNMKLKIDARLVSIFYRTQFKSGGSILSNLMSLLGFIVLLVGFWNLDKNPNFPGKLALIPVLSTLLIIAAGPQAWINQRILSNKVAVFFGLISFPLYLWHWPLLSMAKMVGSETPNGYIRVVLVLLAILLAWLTFKFVECRIRSTMNGKVKVICLVVLMCTIGGTGYSIFKQNGLSYRIKDREDFLSYYENSFPNWKYFNAVNLNAEWRSECAFFNGKKYLAEGKLEGGVINSRPVESIDSSCYKRNPLFNKSVLIWGDSHAQSLSPGVVNAIPNDWQVLQVASSGCTPKTSVELPSAQSQCDQSNYFAMKTIKEVLPDVVLVAQAYDHSAASMSDTTRKLKILGIKKIIFLGPTPRWTSDLPKLFARQLWFTKPKRTYIGIDQNIINLNQKLLEDLNKDKSVDYVDVIGFFCNYDGCLTYTGKSFYDSLTSWDYGHLTPSASKYFAQHLLVPLIVLNN